MVVWRLCGSHGESLEKSCGWLILSRTRIPAGSKRRPERPERHRFAEPDPSYDPFGNQEVDDPAPPGGGDVALCKARAKGNSSGDDEASD